MPQSQRVARVYVNGAVDYCSAPYTSPELAVADCARARPAATRCMLSDYRYNAQLQAHVPTHHNIEWVEIRK